MSGLRWLCLMSWLLTFWFTVVTIFDNSSPEWIQDALAKATAISLTVSVALSVISAWEAQ